MNLIQCFQTNCDWYKSAYINSKPVGILWHDTGAGNPALKRYVQPMETDENYDEMIKLIGYNKYKNDWNHKESGCGLNAWIGKLADGSVATIQAGEWDKTPWGCGTGKYGSCNGTQIIDGSRKYVGQHWLQFEACDDSYKDKDYFAKVYKEACELTAYWCKEFGIDPFGTVEWNGIKVPTITCHAESYSLGVGSNHSDVYKWFKAMGMDKSMDQVRRDVAAILNESQDTDDEPKDISYEVITTINMYANAGDAQKQENVKGHFSPGIYYIYQKYPEGYKGMLNIGKDPSGQKSTGWINPIENQKQISEIEEPTTPPEVEEPIITPPEIEIEEPTTPPEVETEEPTVIPPEESNEPAAAPSVDTTKPETAEPEAKTGNPILNFLRSIFSWIISLFKNGNK